MIALGDVVFFLRGDSSQAEGVLAAFERRAQEVAGGISGFFQNAFSVTFGTLLADAVHGAINLFGNLGKAAIDAVGSFEMMEASVASMTAKELVQADVAPDFFTALEQAQPLAEQTLRWMEQLAIQSPFGSDDVKAAFQVAQTFGFVASATSSVTEAQEQGLVTAQRLTQAMLNQAAATGQHPEVMRRVALALGQMSASGKVMAGDLNQLSNAGISARRILADEFADGSLAKLQELMRKGLIPADQAVLAIVQDMEMVGGAASVMASSWSGIINSLQDIGQFALRDLFRPALEQIKPAALALVAFLQTDTVRGAIAGIGQAMANLVSGPAQGALWLVENFAAVVERAGGMIGQVQLTFQALGSIIGTALSPLLSYLAPIGAAVQSSLGTIPGQIALVLQSFGQLSAQPQLLLAAFAGILGSIGDAFGSFGATVQSAIQQALATFQQLGPEAAASLSGLPGIFGDLFAGLAGMAGGWGAGVVEAFASGMAGAIGFVTSALDSIASTVSYWLTPGSPPPLLPHLDIWGTQAAEEWIGGWDDAQFDAFESFGKSAEGALKNALDLGQMDQGAMANALMTARGAMVEALTQQQRTGAVSEETMSRMTAAAGPAGQALRELAEQHLAVATAADTVAQAERALKEVESGLAIVAGDVAAAQASQDAGLLAAARNRQAALKEQRRVAKRDLAQGKLQQGQAEAAIRIQERQIALQREQLDLLKQLTKEEKAGGGGGGGKKAEIDKVAEAQWQYNYAMADTATKIAMLEERQSQYTQGQAEYWEYATKIGQLDKQREQELEKQADALDKARLAGMDETEQLAYYQEQLAGASEGSAEYARAQEKIAAIEQKREARLQKVADAQWDYEYSVASTAEKIEMLEARQSELTDADEEYWELAEQIAQQQEALDRENEKAAGGAGGGKGKKGPATPGGTADPFAAIKERWATSAAEVETMVKETGEQIPKRLGAAVQERADDIRAGFAALKGRIASSLREAFAGLTAPFQPLIDSIQSNLAPIGGLIAGALFGGWLAAQALPWAGIFAPLLAAAQNLIGFFTTAGPAIPNILLLIGRAAMGLLNPFTVLITLGAALGTAWAGNLMGIRESVGVLVSGIWAVLRPFGATLLQFWNQNGASILQTLGTAWVQISSIVGGVVSILALVIGTGLSAIGAFISEHRDSIVLLFTGAWNVVAGIVTGALGIVQGIVGMVLAAIQGDWSGVWTNLQLVTTSLVGGIVQILQGLGQMMLGGWQLTLAMLQGTWSLVWNAVLGVLIGVWTGILTALGLNTGQAQGVIAGFLTAVSLVWNAIWSSVQLVLSGIWSAMLSLLSGDTSTARETISGMLGEVQTIWSTSWAAVQTLFGEIWTGIVTALGERALEIVGAVSTMIEDAKTAVSDTIGDFVALGADLVMGLVDGVVSKAVDLANSVKDAVLGALGAGQETADTGSPSRLFRDELGVPIGQGPGAGVDLMADEAARSVENLVLGMAEAGQRAIEPIVPEVSLPEALAGAAGRAGLPGGAGVAGALNAGGGGAIDRMVALLEQLVGAIQRGELGGVQVGPNQLASELDVEAFAYQVAGIIQRKRRVA